MTELERARAKAAAAADLPPGYDGDPIDALCDLVAAQQVEIRALTRERDEARRVLAETAEVTAQLLAELRRARRPE